MKRRSFLSSLLALPMVLAGCVHWPGIDNKKRKAVETPKRADDGHILPIWTQTTLRTRSLSPAYIEAMERILTP